jgi:hypothetical protein
MGDSKRGIDRHTAYPALVVALGVLGYWWVFYQAGVSSGRHEERAQIEREHYAAEAAQQLSDVCGKLVGAAATKCAYDVAKSERESRRSESDLNAQWEAADWVFWAGIIGAAQLIATATGLFFIKRTLDANWKAVDAAQATTRAYIAIERARLIPGPARAYGHSGDVVVDLSAENIGKSSAHVIAIEFWPVKTNSWPPPHLLHAPHFRAIAVRGEGSAEIGKVQASMNGKDYPYVVGRVLYGSAFSADHYAHFCIEVKKVGDASDYGDPERWDAASFFKGRDWPKDT